VPLLEVRDKLHSHDVKGRLSFHFADRILGEIGKLHIFIQKDSLGQLHIVSVALVGAPGSSLTIHGQEVDVEDVKP
jgi:hypothetical protein